MTHIPFSFLYTDILPQPFVKISRMAEIVPVETRAAD